MVLGLAFIKVLIVFPIIIIIFFFIIITIINNIIIIVFCSTYSSSCSSANLPDKAGIVRFETSVVGFGKERRSHVRI